MARQKSLTPLVLLAVAGTGSGCHEAVNTAPRTGDFDATRSDESLLANTVPQVERIQSRVVEYGRSVEGRALWLIRIEGASRRAGLRPAVLLMGGSQGGEELGVLDHLPEAFRKGWLPSHLSSSGQGFDLDGVHGFLMSGGVIYIAPTVNPDGQVNRTYENANGVNLNRDWANQTQPETRYLIEYLRSDAEYAGTDLRLVVDYHIGIPRLLYPRADSRTPIPYADLLGHLAFHEMMPREISKQPISLFDSIRDLYAEAPSCEVQNDCVLPPRCLDGDWNCGCLYDDEWEGGRCVIEPVDPVEIERRGLSNDFFYEAFGAMSFIYEADPQVDFNNVNDHAVWIDRSLAYLATGEQPVERLRAFDVRDVARANHIATSIDPER